MSLTDVQDKHNSVIEYLRNCPEIQRHPLFFNFSEREDNNQLFATYADSIDTIRTYIDGSRELYYTFSVIVYKSISYIPVVSGHSDENMEEFIDVQSIANWIEEQNDNYIFPDFGEDCVIDSIETLTNVPLVDTNTTSENEMQPALAQYSLGVRIKYLDTSKTLWNS